MARRTEHTLSPSAYGLLASAPPVEESFQHTTDEKVPLTEAEVYDPQQQMAGTYSTPFPEPPPSYAQSEDAHKQAPYPSAGTYTHPTPASYVTNTQQPQAPGIAPAQQYPVPFVAPAPQPYLTAPPIPVAVTPVVQPPATVVVVGSQALTPGTCSVCRRGQIKKSPSCCSWICCIFLFPAFIIPGLIALFCCCQKPKCTHCKYSP